MPAIAATGEAMDEKIRMTVIVNPLVSPLLFAALAPFSSPRARAMQLRSLAEATLLQRMQTAHGTAMVALDPRHSSGQTIPTPNDVHILEVPDASTGELGISPDALADQLGGFLD
ncbi:hypothetical protein SAMN05192543_1173 [Paraburkholderia megapolitana]|uniref:Uncharacterized protein n=2 Tax=Paraburkholderia megapolitana TaxID=420953 RepID=A0A1I3W7N0_9BURK|nr:hypothetical protein SAMN05192543_1173 [Paraburkholderia megapolitana]